MPGRTSDVGRTLSSHGSAAQVTRAGFVVIVTLLHYGCQTSRPRGFGDLLGPTPITRARAAGMGDHLPDEVVVPRLINSLSDPDGVVRLVAHDELRRRTGQDFGYLPWSDEAERNAAVANWTQWWQGQGAASSQRRADPAQRRR